MKTKVLNTPIITSSADFEHAVLLFSIYKPVKIEKSLKNKFQTYINKHFMNMGIEKWSATIYPQVKSYKFQRT